MTSSESTVSRHRTVTARILAVLVLPLSMLLFVTVDDAIRSAEDADRERRAGASIDRLDRSVRLQTRIADERLMTAFAARIAEDETGTAATLLQGVGPDAVRAARDETDDALRVAGSDVRFDSEDLDDARTLFDTGVGSRLVLARYDGLVDDAANAVSQASFALISAAAGSGEPDQPLALIGLSSSLASHLAVGDQVEALVDLLYAEGVEFQLLRSELGRMSESVSRAVDQSATFAPSTAPAENPIGDRFDRLVGSALLADVPLLDSGAVETQELAVSLQDGLGRRASLLEETVRGAEVARQVAQESQEASERSALRSFLAALGALVVSLAAAIYLARSVVRSLRLRDELERRLFRQATVDDLTGAVNRGPALERIDAARAEGRDVAVLFIDLDRFKDVNDRQGHPVGDEVLRIVARRLERVTRPADTVARIGGDEFLVIVPDARGIDEAIELGWRIVDTLTRHYVVDGAELELGASVGVASSMHADDAEDLLRSADLAVYAAKSTGRHVVAYTEEFDEAVKEVNRTEQALRQGIARGSQLSLDFQPVVAATTGVVTGLEALVRWNRPGHGLVSPDVFVPIAERTRLVVDLDVWVLHTALADLVRIRRETGLAHLTVAVNASGMTVSDRDFVMRVRVAVESAGVDAAALGIEVTETALVTDLARMASHLRELREFGVRVSIDDFGTGYTSIAQLRTLPADILKIDRSIVNGAGAGDGALMPLVVEVASRFGLTTIAEGVETAAHESMALDLGVDGLQGFGIAPPMSRSDLVELLRGRARLRAPVTLEM